MDSGGAAPGAPAELTAIACACELELLCWCAPLPCHAEVVRSALLWLAGEEGGLSTRRLAG